MLNRPKPLALLILESFGAPTEHHQIFDCPLGSLPTEIKNGMGDVLSNLGMKQLKLADAGKSGAVDRKRALTADHGNIEQMRDEETGQPFTSQRVNQRPFAYAGMDEPLAAGSRLPDLAPTMLEILAMQPAEMTGRSPLTAP